MVEMIVTYDLQNPKVSLPMPRDEFYKEQVAAFKATGQPTHAVEVIGLFLFNTDGRIILQKRSNDKNHNPGLIDKAIGGHVSFGDSPFYTLMVETVQELRVPSIVLHTPDEFKKTYQLLKSYLENIAIVKFLDEGIFKIEKNFKDGKAIIANKAYLFLGVYAGGTKPVDNEAAGVLYYDLEVLKKEMELSPQNFTPDLHFYLNKYQSEIDGFLKTL